VLDRDIRVLVWGLGNMGSGVVRELSSRSGVVVVGGVCSRPEKDGKDVGDLVGLGAPIGALATTDGRMALDLTKPDAVVVASGSTVVDVLPAIEHSLAAGAHVVSIAEEMAYPWRHDPGIAAQIDEIARAAGKTVLGTGVNPGFVLDTLIVALTGACLSVERVYARRVNDLGPYGKTVLHAQGVGLTPEEFERAAAAGEIVGHVGFPESISMIADALGWRLTEIRETREPIVTKVRREVAGTVVEAGMVAGCRQRAWGLVAEPKAARGGAGPGAGPDGETGRAPSRVVIELDHPQQIRPEAEGVETLDEIVISGSPPIALTVKPEIAGGIATVALACNMIPLVMDAAPGLVSMVDLPVPRGVAGDMRRWLDGASERGVVGPVAGDEA
jgi:hypothetical protein